MPKLVTANLSNNAEPCILRYETSNHNKLYLNTEAFDAEIIKHIYDKNEGIVIFDRPITKIGCITDVNQHSLTSITIPNNVKEIESGAFFNFIGLANITIPDSVVYIGKETFSGCKNLESVHISNLSSWCKIDFGDCDANPISYAKNLYHKGSLVTKLIIPSDITAIAAFAFYHYYNLTSIIIPNNIISIGWAAFDNCKNLKSVYIGNGVKSIEDFAFYGCTGELTINCNIPSHQYHIDDFTGQEWEGRGAFEGSEFTKVSIGNDVTEIGISAFNCCKSLECFNGKFASLDNRCLIIDKSLVSFAPAGLTEYTIPSGTTRIEWKAFCSCNNLMSVTIPSSVTSIGMDAFSNCSRLSSITIPDGITRIGDGAFKGCTSLSSITLGKNVSSIGEWAFERCNNLKSIICKAIIPPKLGDYGDRHAIGHIPEDVTIVIPEGCEDAYMNSDWKSLFEE